MQLDILTIFAVFQVQYYGTVHGYTDCRTDSCKVLENLQTAGREIISKQTEQDNALSAMSSKVSAIRRWLRPDSELVSRITEMSSSVTKMETAVSADADALASSTAQIISEVQSLQAHLQTNVVGVTTGVNSQMTTSEENIRTDLTVCESNILGGLKESESTINAIILAAIATSEHNVISSVEASQTDIETAIQTSKNNVVTDISDALDTSESNIIGAVDASESDVVTAIGTSESNIESAINTSEGDIISAVGTSESSVISSVSVAETTITTAIGASEADVIDTIVNSETNVTVAVEASEANVIALINSKCGLAPASAYVDNSNLKDIQIELDIFTGVPNPSWTVTNETGEFEILKTALTGAKSSAIPMKLGYRGFVVTATFDDGTIVYRTYGQGGQSSTTLETTLLNSNDGTLSSDVIAIAAAGINNLSPPDIGTVESLSSVSLGSDTCGRNSPCVEPDFDPSDWTSALENSYNYAVNAATGTYAQPGRGAGSLFLDLSGKAVRGAAVLDGVKDHDDEDPGDFPTTNNCLIILTIIPGVDYHFFRQDDDGNWSHKLGPHQPTNLDNSGSVITDPRTADIAPYKYQRFMSVCPKRVTIA